MNNNYLTYRISLIKNTCYLLITSIFLLIPMISKAGTNPDSIKKVIAGYKAKAIKYDKKKDMYNAIEYYGRYLSYKSKDIKLSNRLASLCYITRDYAKANQYFDSVIHLNSTKYLLAHYYKGIVCMNLEKYDEAVESFTKFRKLYKSNKDKYSYRKLAAIYIESSTWAKNHPEIDDSVTIAHPGTAVNHAHIDFAPFPVNEDIIIYGALYADASKNIPPVRQIYQAVKIEGHWKTLGLLNGEVNNPEYNTGNAVISDNGEKLYFTRSRKNWKNEDINEIYVSYSDGVKWLTPQKLPYPVNDENYTSTQPAIGQNLKTGNEILYFVSNRPGGKGGMDIWYTEFDKKSQTYKEPQDLDKGVNTLGDECSPFYDLSTRTLYFSSKGKKTGFGGYDIYKATGSGKRWTDALPLPKPVNSPYDDYYYSILKNNKEGYFTSNRPGSLTLGNGSCCDDIFSFRINECTMVTSRGTVRNSVNYDIYNNLNEKYHLGLQYPEKNIVLPDVPVELYLTGEKESDDMLIAKTTTDKAGNYHFEMERNRQYKVLVKNYGYFEKRISVNTNGINCSDTLNIGITLINYLPKINVRVNIYYDYDKYKLSDVAQQTIDTTLMPLFDLFPNAIIEIGSHTDSTGTELYNMKLSQKRSESVVNYLISKGIQSERLVAKGYGMSVPIAPNTHSDGTDSPEGRQLNRRTEIKIVGDLSTINIDE
jgi:outer membrane protein OmpA-like peptidoglycan-associated protein/tetratricopeptide (TPR) repeat protein